MGGASRRLPYPNVWGIRRPRGVQHGDVTGGVTAGHSKGRARASDLENVGVRRGFARMQRGYVESDRRREVPPGAPATVRRAGDILPRALPTEVRRWRSSRSPWIRCGSLFHYPPELFSLVVDTIPRLCRSKADVLLFFRGAGIEEAQLQDIRAVAHIESGEPQQVRNRANGSYPPNEKGERSLRERREILKRIVEFEDFSTCWPEVNSRQKDWWRRIAASST